MATTDVIKISPTSSMWSVAATAPEGTRVTILIRNRPDRVHGELLGVIKDAIVIGKTPMSGPTLIPLNAIDELEIEE